MELDEYKKEISALSKDELIKECINVWIDLQQEKDYQQTLIQEGKKCIDMERA